MRSRKHRGEPGWARAKRILIEMFEKRAGGSSQVAVGRVRKIGDGLSRDVFVAEVTIEVDQVASSGFYTVLLPRWDADPEVDQRTQRELELLPLLRQKDLPVRIPAVLGTLRDSGHLVVVREFIDGVPLDLRIGRQGDVLPWEVVGQIAAIVHSLEVSHLADIVPGHDTRQTHAEARLEIFSDCKEPELREAHAWCLKHLPPAEPSTLLHGDLLGQNILLDWEGPPAVIDWEYAQRGDPAYDLAIVTRGVRRPFQIDRGLERLLDSYWAAGGAQVTQQHVYLYELCLVAGEYRASLEGQGGHKPEQVMARLRSVLRRVTHSTDSRSEPVA